jgi:hypothetical protein
MKGEDAPDRGAGHVVAGRVLLVHEKVVCQDGLGSNDVEETVALGDAFVYHSFGNL